MCFSATGSFTLATVLAAVGVASIARAPTPSHRMFAAVPLIFAAQQAMEGVVWVTVGDPAHGMLQRFAVMSFLGLALIVWPIWLPVALRRIEREPTRRRILAALAWFGVGVAVCAGVLLARWQPVAVVAHRSIRYDRAGTTDVPRDLLVLLAYVIPTIGPFFVSTVTLARLIGVALVLSLVAATIVERDAMTSVWCFFAAMLSVLLLRFVGREASSANAAA
jgi:hypothetical protein